ncbi:hypothetical protein RYX56_00540 [Alkalihalophilus lindianensis]|uniref:Uncharacterized protein n=1 Tax=Alkalihalophilus lindianensis TaxID=1630542 RepID=A0ABU3X4P8_9BACI|nr:hypothetical protein [Alkalihalophilus lindianensis]MDV2682851.1 hypothetical protein [Alkalihalophilus lindianensis]
MKRYLVFIVSFGVLYIVFELISGLILTTFFTPEFVSVESSLQQEVALGYHSSIPLLMLVSVATIAFFISNKVSNVYGA